MNNKIKRIISMFTGKVQEDYFYNIVQHMVDTLFVVDLHGRIKTVNKSLLNLLGYEEEELIGRPADILFGEDKKFFHEIGWRKLLQEGVVRNLDMSYLTKDRKQVSLSFTGSVMRDSLGYPEAVVFVNKDLSSIKASVAELETTNADLANEVRNKDEKLSEIEIRLNHEMRRGEELDEKAKQIDSLENSKMEMEIEISRRSTELSQALTQLKMVQDNVSQKDMIEDVEKISAGIAHEIRNPLSYIGMAVQYVVDKLTPQDPQKELLMTVNEKINKVKDVTQNLIQFSRTYHMDLKPLKIDSVLDKIVYLIKPRCERQNIEIVKEYNSHVPEIMADHGKMEEVIFNLVENAIKFMPDRGILRIGLHYNQRNEIIIRIGNTGKSIPEDNKSKIFEPFFSTTGSTGMGLFIVKRIVETHKGKISVESSEGQETIFSIILPAINAS